MMKMNLLCNASKFALDLFDYLPDFPDSDDIINAVEAYNADHNRHYKVASGATRTTVIGQRYVVKFETGTEWCKNRFGGNAREYACYLQAMRDGVADMFAPCAIFRYHGADILLMERTPKASCYASKPAPHKVIERLTIEQRLWLIDHNVDDLHMGNYGMRDGKPVFFDYACNDA